MSRSVALMSERTARRLAWCGWAGSVALLALTHAIRAFVADPPAGAGSEDITLGFLLIVSALILTYSTVGAVVAAGRSENPVGWIFLVSALGAALLLCAAVYAEGVRPAITDATTTTTAGGVAAFLSEALGLPTLALLSLVLLVFPDGRLPSRRWRPAAWITAAVVAMSVLTAFAPGPIGEQEPPVLNPLGVQGAAGEVLEELVPVPGFLLLTSLLLGALSIFFRFRRSRGDERLQLKWFVYTTAFLAGCILVGSVAEQVAPAGGGGAGLVEEGAFLCALLAVAALPVAAAVAIFRYRLYDIDVVINRTLVYGALTATLAATYLAGVVVLQLALSPLTSDSGLAVAGSTLAVAALFRPARARIQALVDRRFYRRRYDAQRTLEAFAARLRDEVALDSVSAELSGVVRETVQPAHVSLWLRTPEARR